MTTEGWKKPKFRGMY